MLEVGLGMSLGGEGGGGGGRRGEGGERVRQRYDIWLYISSEHTWLWAWRTARSNDKRVDWSLVLSVGRVSGAAEHAAPDTEGEANAETDTKNTEHYSKDSAD